MALDETEDELRREVQMTAASATNVPEEPPFGYRIDVTEEGATSTIALEGECDLAQQAATTHAISQVLGRRPACLVLDLSQLSFIDSCGIHALIDARNRCAAQGTHLVIIPGPRAVQRVFEICGLIEILPFAGHRPRPTATKLRPDRDGDG
ncbi:MAG: STAS domain-containing protein [Solirubrobacteraceae bacterium]